MEKKLTTYKKLCTEFYDLEKNNDQDTRDSLAFYEIYALQAQGPILEPMCGTGRFLIPLHQGGFDIEGFDASEYMIESLREKCLSIGANQPKVWQQFVQDFKQDKKYALIFVPFGSWGLVTDITESDTSLRIMYDHLQKGGKLILEIETVYSVPKCGVWNRAVHTRLDGSYLAINSYSQYDETTQVYSAVCRYESIRNGHIEEIESEDFMMFLYKPDQMDNILTNIGFTIIKYRNHAKEPATIDSPLIIYECTK